MSAYVLLIDAFPYGLATAGTPAITSWVGLSDPGVTILADSLEQPSGALSARLRPTEGDCSVSPLAFVVHDVRDTTDYTITDLCTRDLDSIEKVLLTAAVTAGAGTIDVSDGTPFGLSFLPRDLWINGECMRATALAFGTQVTVTRAKYGSRARAIAFDEDEAVIPEVFLSCPGITRRRCSLVRVDESGVATLIYIGHCDHAPRLNEDGMSWTISTTHVATRELGITLASGQGQARNVGYDDTGSLILVERDDATGVLGSSAFLSRKRRIHQDFSSMLDAVRSRVSTALVGAGATTVSVSASTVGAQTTVSVSATIDPFTLRVQIANDEQTASSVDASVERRAKVVFFGADRGAISRFGWQPYATPPSSDTARLTVLATSSRFPIDDASWTASTSAGAITATITPILAAPWDDDFQLVLDPRGQTTPYWSQSNTTNTDPAQQTFRANAYLRAKDPAVAESTPPPAAGALVYSGVLVFQREFLVESAHWLYALQWLFDAAAISDETDARNWDWSDIARAASATAAGVAAEVNWRIAADREVGEFLLDECALRGSCLSIKGGKLAVVAIKQPTASETVAATFTDDDLRGSGDGPRAQLEQWEDGVVTCVQIASPLRDVRVIDAVARARYGDGRTIELRAEGLRHARAAIDDPVQWARDIAQRPLRLWSQPVYLLRLPLTVAARGTVELGDVIQVTVSTLPNGTGSRGLVDRRAQVIGIEEDFATGDVTIEALVFALAYGYAPAAKVASISTDTLTLDTGYVPTAGDYAGSALASYTGTANDGGASMFNVGDFIELVERNNASPFATETREIIAVNPAGPTIQLDAAPAGGWGALAWVDIRTAKYGDCVATQRADWAYVCESAAPREISASVPGRKWAT